MLPFIKNNIHNHLKVQHPLAFAAYSLLCNDDKKAYFDKILNKNSIVQYLDNTQQSLKFPIAANIVEKIIGNMFFHPQEDEEDEDNEPITKTNAMKLFKKQPNVSYLATITNPFRFDLAMKHRFVGLSS